MTNTSTILQDTHSIAFQRRHTWQRREVTADGKVYGITSVLPIRDRDFRSETAADKLRYLVEGTKR